MNRTDAPAKQPKPFGINGQREPILPATPAGDNTASYESGFPPITMILKSAGGLPPKGQDVNQILFELSALCRWESSGALNTFDSAFATDIGGYPQGAAVISDDYSQVYISTMDANSNNPNSTSIGWSNLLSFIGGAPLNSPTFTGIPAAPTAPQSTNTSQIATTAFVKSAITALSLGNASTRNVGTGSISNIPDMSSFRGSMLANGYVQLPIIGAGGGAQTLMIQWGIQSTAPASNALYNLNVSFPTSILWATGGRGATGSNASMGVSPEGTQQIRIQNYAPSGPNENCFWIAIGN